MTHDDVLFGYRLRLFTLAEELGNTSQACRQMGVARSTYYVWKRRLERYGLDGLRVRERRRPRMPNAIGPHLEHRVLAFALGHPGFGPRRISAELARPKWGGIRISEHGVWRVLKRFNLNTRSKRHALIARHADPYERKPDQEPKALHIDASEPGEKVQMDCFYVGRLSGSALIRSLRVHVAGSSDDRQDPRPVHHRAATRASHCASSSGCAEFDAGTRQVSCPGLDSVIGGSNLSRGA